jgi:hypothetical protein
MSKPTTPPASIHAAFAAALAEMTSPTANKVNPAFKSRYATLDHILDHVRPILSKHGLALTQSVHSEEGRVGVLTRIVGQDGFLDLGSITIATKPETNAQQVGGILTYLRRQSIQASLGIATDLDDDGNETAGATLSPAGKTWTPRA